MPLPRVVWLVPVALFFLNPALACGDEPEFRYGAAEMRAAVEGTWTLTRGEGATQQLTVNIEQDTRTPQTAQAREARVHGLIRTAHACGTRTLVKSAGACVDISQMPLKVTMVSGDPVFQDAALSGTFTIHSLVFVAGEVSLSVGAENVVFTLSADGMPSNPRWSGTQGAVTVVRQLAR
jgi:hypothetical protein